MDMAQNVAIDKHGLAINGRRFPFYVSDEIDVDIEHPTISFVTVRILAESVSIGEGVEVDEDGSVLFVDEPAPDIA